MMRSLTLAAVLAAAVAVPAFAQTTTTKSPAVTAVQDAMPLKLTEAQAKGWVDKQVYSSDGKKIGEIAAFARGTDNTVTEMHIDIGGFLGMGETRVKLMPAQFKFETDRAVLNVTAAQAKDLPRVQK